MSRSWTFGKKHTESSIRPDNPRQAAVGKVSDPISPLPIPTPLFNLVVSSSLINLIGPAVCVLRSRGTWMLLCTVVSAENWNRPTIRLSALSLSTVYGVPAVGLLAASDLNLQLKWWLGPVRHSPAHELFISPRSNNTRRGDSREQAAETEAF